MFVLEILSSHDFGTEYSGIACLSAKMPNWWNSFWSMCFARLQGEIWLGYWCYNFNFLLQVWWTRSNWRKKQHETIDDRDKVTEDQWNQYAMSPKLDLACCYLLFPFADRAIFRCTLKLLDLLTQRCVKMEKGQVLSKFLRNFLSQLWSPKC